MPKPKKPKVGATEKQVTEQVLEAAAMLGIELKRRNVGGMTGAGGRYVAFAEPGDADYYATLPGGIHLDLELKREAFDPRTVRGKDRVRFDGQLARLRKTNELGGVGFWVTSGPQFLNAMLKVLDGWRVEIDPQGFPWIVSPDEHARSTE